MDVRLPDGTIIKGVPDGTTKADLAAKLKANGMAVPSEWLDEAPKPSAAESVGATLREIPRQVGLTARYGLEAVGGLADIGVEPLRQIVVNPALRAMGLPEASSTVQGMATDLATKAGLPQPRDANERVIGDAARTVASAGAMGGAAGSLARAVGAPAVGAAQTSGSAVTNWARNAAQAAKSAPAAMAANPGTQAVGAAAAGGSGGAVREAGGGPLEQFAAALVAGVAGGGTTSAANNLAGSAYQRLRSLLTPRTEIIRAADQQIELALQRSGLDWSRVPDQIKAGLRDEVAQALAGGQPLNPDALRRLVAFRQTGTTPTVGMLTQDPGQITREMNLAKTGANSMDPNLQRLPALQNSNIAQLLRQLDQAGAANAPNAQGAARAAINSLDGTVAREQARIDRLYAAARDTSGRSLPLEGGAFTRRANELLDQEMVGGALPADVANTMNRIAKGEMPFTVEIAEQLKTRIGKLQRASNDGTARMALGLVRQALDEAPLQNPNLNPRNLPAVSGTVPPSPTIAGQESIDAFNAARRTNREWMQRLEGNPALRAVAEGVEPDQFVQRFLVGKSATAADVRALAGELEPRASEALRQYIVRHLRDAATNSTDDITKFSNDAYRRALRDIGDEKLSVFFDRDQVAQLRAIGDAGKYMQAQPAGSAVNNSNSGALVLGRGLEVLERLANYVPLGGRDIIKGAIQGRQQTKVLTPSEALTLIANGQAQAKQPSVSQLLAILAASGEQRQDERGN
jgi:hypothetical protein